MNLRSIIGIRRIVKKFPKSKIKSQPVNKVMVFGGGTRQICSLTCELVVPYIGHKMYIFNWYKIQACCNKLLLIIGFIGCLKTNIFSIGNIIIILIRIKSVKTGEKSKFVLYNISMYINRDSI